MRPRKGMQEYEKVTNYRRARPMIRGYKELRRYVPLGETELRDRVKKGTFPPPMQLGPRAIAWFEDVIAEAQDALAREQAEAHTHRRAKR